MSSATIHCLVLGCEATTTVPAVDVEDAVDQLRKLGWEVSPPLCPPHNEEAERDTAPCSAETHSWDVFRPEQVDSYWLTCSRLGPHDVHKNSETGATWRDAPEPGDSR